MKLWLARCALMYSLAAVFSCSSPGSAEKTGTTTSAVSAPDKVCAEWTYSVNNLPASSMSCDIAPDIGKFYQAMRQSAGANANTLSMWVRWPSDEGLEEDADKLRAWFDQSKHLLAWLKAQSDLSLFERSIKQMLREKGRLQDSAQRLLNKKSGAIGDTRALVENKVKALANDPEKAALVADLSEVRTKIDAMKTILNRTKSELTALQPTYQILVNEFKAYKETEPDVMSRISGFSQSASVADLPGLQQVKVAVADYERSLAPADDHVRLRAAEMRAELVAIQAGYERAMAPYGEFAASHAVQTRDFVETALRSVGNMIAYCEARRDATNKAIAKIVDGMRARTDALVELGVEQATRDTLANARYLDASKGFLDQSNARIANLWASPPTSPTLKYPFYNDQYDGFTSFQQLESMCSQAALATSSWMQAGCNAMKPSFDRARSWMSETLPGALRMRLVLLRRKNANENLCKEIESQLAAGNLKAAVAAYDAAVNLLDPSVTP